jgi:NTE family protein
MAVILDFAPNQPHMSTEFPSPHTSDGRIALCLTSSYLGFFAHAGFLDGLGARGIFPGHISGCSSGAYVAGLYASGMSAAAITEFLMDPRMVGAFWEWGFMGRGIGMSFNIKGVSGLLSGNRAINHLRPYLEGRRIEDCHHPRLAIAVSNLHTRRGEIAEEGPLMDHMLASCAVPGLFRARRIGPHQFWDGALGNPAPITHWLDDPEIETIIIHQITTPEEIASRREFGELSIHQAFHYGFDVTSGRIVELSIQLAERAGKRVEIVETVSPRPAFFQKPAQRRQQWTAGRAAATAFPHVLPTLEQRQVG